MFYACRYGVRIDPTAWLLLFKGGNTREHNTAFLLLTCAYPYAYFFSILDFFSVFLFTSTIFFKCPLSPIMTHSSFFVHSYLILIFFLLRFIFSIHCFRVVKEISNTYVIAENSVKNFIIIVNLTPTPRSELKIRSFAAARLKN